MIDNLPLQRMLDTLLRTARQSDKDMHHFAVNGHCDAFAIALEELIKKEIPEARTHFVMVSRERLSLGRRPKVIDENPFSHVLLDVEGIPIDVCGVGAEEAWEESWIQPDPDDEIVPCEDVFSFDPISKADIIALRQKRDNRDPDPEMIKRFEKTLTKAFEQVRPQSKPAKRVRVR